jgi:hypothetical protein
LDQGHGHWLIGKVLGATGKLYHERNAGIYRGRTSRAGGQLWGARSEHAEACRLVGDCMIRHLRIYDLRLASGRDYAACLSLGDIVRETQISIDRVSAAIRTFTSLGWLRGVQPREQSADGSWIHRVKVRWLTYDFFRALGPWIVRAINRARGKAATYRAKSATVSPAAPAPEPVDPRDSWPDD